MGEPHHARTWTGGGTSRQPPPRAAAPAPAAGAARGGNSRGKSRVGENEANKLASKREKLV